VTNTLTVEALRWALLAADGDLLLDEVPERFAEAQQLERGTREHAERVAAYERHLRDRREHEREQIEGASQAAKEAALARSPISREDLFLVAKEAGEAERERLEADPAPTFEEWASA
jgi:hypothetical protein